MLRIRLYGDPVLRQKTRAVTSFDQALKDLAEEMVATMREAEGLGLSANQVGRSLNLFVLDWRALGKPLDWQAFVNARIVSAEGDKTVEEGCLSVPGIRDEVRRFQKVRLWAQDLEGEPFEIEAEGLLAQAFQHETDHLAGVLFIDRMSPVTRDLLKGRLREVVRSAEEGREGKGKAHRGPEDRGASGR